MAVEIPSRLRKALEAAPALESAVKLSLKAFEPLLKDNKLPFFPEYTDHGIEHIEGVMRTVEALIRDQAWEVVTAADAATLSLACLVHDIAMHLTRDGFVSLVTQKEGWRIQDAFEDRPWDALWADFVAEAKRFDGRTLTTLFGSSDPVKAPEVTTPESWTERQLKLIGEFIRRHHHRLAHQIALNRMPGPKLDRTQLKECDEDIADIAGLVARSHGMPLRDCIPCLEDRYHAKREHRGIHAVFLMAVLRVADYLQVEAERAPKELLKVKQLRSPVSQREWRAHDAIKDIKSSEEDIESLYIHALPNDVGTYLRLKELLAGIQSELDTSWAVLGEVYSRYTKEKLDSLGLSIRRVTSNLDDEEAFAESVPYVPCHAVFDTAGSELMKLLVEPLYGDNPYIGVRELLQNAVDAVRELEELLRMRDDLKDIERPVQDADVVITLKQEDDESLWLVVSDRGIGMSADTIQNYFLKAGACLRHSLDWRKTFEDKPGSSRVLRSGRFGIGVFATFLLGQQIHVSTRHPDSEQGLEFRASIDDDLIELRRVTRRVGTTVRVTIDEMTALRLLQNTKAWDWYVLEKPSVRRTIEIKNITAMVKHAEDSIPGWSHEDSESLRRSAGQGVADQPFVWPQPHSDLPQGWHRIIHDDYQDIHWANDDKTTRRSVTRWKGNPPLLVCNGIVVATHDMGTRPLPWMQKERFATTSDLRGPLNTGLPDSLRFKPPVCSCFDPDNMLALNLQRTGVSRTSPLVDDLRDAMLDDFLAFAFVLGPTEPLNEPPSLVQYWSGDYPGLASPADLLSLVCTSNGFTACDPWLLRRISCDSILTFYVSEDALMGLLHCDDLIHDSSYVEPFYALTAVLERHPVSVSKSAIRFVQRKYLGRRARLLDEHPGIFGPLAGVRILINREVQQKNFTAHLEYLGYLMNTSYELADLGHLGIAESWTLDKWLVLSFGRCPEHGFDFRLFAAHQPQRSPLFHQHFIISEWFLEDEEVADIEPSLVSQRWMDVFGTPFIPYDPAERKKHLSHAYEQLGEYVEAWEAIRSREA